jgi:hypothetical protein
VPEIYDRQKKSILLIILLSIAEQAGTLSIIYVDVMGLKIFLYDGGWNEWSMDSPNPAETGEQLINNLREKETI